MPKHERFTFLCDKNERALIAMLAKRLRRSQSDAVRFLVVEAAKELNADAPKTTKWTTDRIAFETYRTTAKMLRANYVAVILTILMIIVAILNAPFLQGAIQHFLYGATPTLTPMLAPPTATP